MSSIIFIPGIITSPQGLKDGTIKFTTLCNELEPEKIGQLFTLNNKYVFHAIKEESFLNEEIQALEQLKSDEKIGKSRSERLRSVLFLAWKNKDEGFEIFDSYYKFKMEKFISHVKSKLPEL